jgi:hypothetical protein
VYEGPKADIFADSGFGSHDKGDVVEDFVGILVFEELAPHRQGIGPVWQ